ncbi:ROK family transcriptional regulator [Paracoccus alkanivorans]|uniref:ROK family transcriptional regulator n=1 Tax=Paracoccus alkanivorans TaxID=2116655 RepID=A0A3M0MNE3_9RHOB|nr:ROK family transcriptional regulator [Paracoccus alkanivorans]RMC37220.1 ROK family transcriptional regulator [Paracoccus alkanivorans]
MTYSPNALIAPHFLRAADDDVVSGNERNLLRAIWLHPGLSRSELTALSDLSQQSVHRILDALAERGLIIFGDPKQGLGSGQPSPMLYLNGAHAYCVGISVNSDIIDICMIDLAGKILAQDSFTLWRRPMRECLDLISTFIAKRQAKLQLHERAFFGIGLAIAGFHIAGTRYNATLPLHEWSLIELGPLLAEHFGKPVWTINGGKSGAIAEAMFGIGRYVKNFAYLSFNYGFGGGLICDGALLDGGNGNAGEFSQMFDEEEVLRRPALQLLMEALKRNGTTLPTISILRENFDPNWPGLAEWVEEVTPAYNRLVNAIWAIFDPQAIVFGGEVPPELAEMLIRRTRLFGKPRYGVSRPHPKLIVSEIGSDAAAMGAAIRPFNLTFY